MKGFFSNPMMFALFGLFLSPFSSFASDYSAGVWMLQVKSTQGRVVVTENGLEQEKEFPVFYTDAMFESVKLKGFCLGTNGAMFNCTDDSKLPNMHWLGQ